MPSPEDVRERLDRVAFPGFRHSLVRYGLVREVEISDADVSVTLLPATARREVADEVRRRVTDAVRELPGVRSVRVGTAEPAHSHGPSAEARPRELAGVRRVLAISSAKGGVGKSTVAVNLALALRARGSHVALMDADVYGPSIPMMMGTDARPRPAGTRVAPVERYGIALMSMGFFLDDKSPVIWRGPMVMGLIRQFLHDVDWGEQDYLVVDMPPGTGDAALTLAQQVPISGAVIVTTPQEVALQDVERGVAMFRQVSVPILGIVENMSHYVCPECGEREEIFGTGGGESLARQFGIPLLGRLPIIAAIRESGDAGRPIVVTDAAHPASREFAAIAGSIDQALGRRPSAEA